jgi:predicted nucleic acid-binding protein
VLSEEIIIADSGPLIGLARIGQLGLLPQLARRIVVPRAVWSEVTGARTDAPGASEVAAQTWIEVLEANSLVVAPLTSLNRGDTISILKCHARFAN